MRHAQRDRLRALVEGGPSIRHSREGKLTLAAPPLRVACLFAKVRSGAGWIGLALLIAAYAALSFSVVVSLFPPVVREHCLNVSASEAPQSVVVDTQWTVILWPPPPLHGSDPAGRCIRNTVGREFLAKVGIWELPPRQEQVREHVITQLTAP